MTAERHTVTLTLDPASKAQIEAAERLCVELKVARDALDRAIGHAQAIVKPQPPSAPEASAPRPTA